MDGGISEDCQCHRSGAEESVDMDREPLQKIRLGLPDSLVRELDTTAKQTGQSFSELVRNILKAGVAHSGQAVKERKQPEGR